MALRTAGIKDPSLLSTLRDLEERIRTQEAKPGSPSTLLLEQSIEDIKADIKKLKQATLREAVNAFVPQGTMHLPGMVPDPGPTNVRTDRVLHANGEWASPLNGQLSLVPSGTGGSSTDQPTANLKGSLAITSALRADTISARVFVEQETHGMTLFTTSAINVIVWQAPYNYTLLAVRGYRVGGSGATVNARRNGASQHLASDLSLTSADVWMDGGAVQDATYSVGDKAEIMLVTTSGSPTQVRIIILAQRR